MIRYSKKMKVAFSAHVCCFNPGPVGKKSQKAFRLFNKTRNDLMPPSAGEDLQSVDIVKIFFESVLPRGILLIGKPLIVQLGRYHLEV